jgi:hypothetical protein
LTIHIQITYPRTLTSGTLSSSSLFHFILSHEASRVKLRKPKTDLLEKISPPSVVVAENLRKIIQHMIPNLGSGQEEGTIPEVAEVRW